MSVRAVPERAPRQERASEREKCAMNIHVVRTDAPVRAHAHCATRTSPEKSKSWLLYARGACGALLPRAPFAPPVRGVTGVRRVQQRRTIHVRALAWPSVLMPPLVHARVDRARAASIISYPIFSFFFVFLQEKIARESLFGKDEMKSSGLVLVQSSAGQCCFRHNIKRELALDE